jgi:hypothetical protein
MGHTEGRLTVALDSMSLPNTTYSLWPENAAPVACTVFTHARTDNENYANAERLAAAWNACAGISTETLANLPEGALQRLVEASSRMLEQVTSQPIGNLKRMAELEGRVEWYDGLTPIREELRAALAPFEEKKGEQP